MCAHDKVCVVDAALSPLPALDTPLGIGPSCWSVLTRPDVLCAQEIVPTYMSAYFMSSSKLMNEAMKKNATSKVPVAWMLYSIELLADVRLPSPDDHYYYCAPESAVCPCTGTVDLYQGEQWVGRSLTSGTTICDPGRFQLFRPLGDEVDDLSCWCTPFNNSLSRRSTMYEYDLYGQIDGPAMPFYVELERNGWKKYEKNLTLLNEVCLVCSLSVQMCPCVPCLYA